MPRIRTLKPEHKVHRKVGRLDDRTYRLWVGLITEADDEGRFIADAEQLRAVVFPYHPKVKAREVEAALGTLAGVGLVTLYQVNGTRYGCFPDWTEHQRISHALVSKFPPCSEDSRILQNSPEDSALARARGSDQGSDQGSRIKDQGGAYRPVARRILEFLNEKAGKSYRVEGSAGAVNIELVIARLKDGATEANCRAVIARQVREWKGTELEKYLRPETLFNRTKFESYLGQRSPEPHDAPVS